MEKEQARAPYNFIQLNDIIVPSKVNEYIEKLYLRNKNNINYSNKKNRKMLNEAGYKAFIKDGIKYNGYFDVDIENITPLYFGGENGLSVDGIHKAIPGSSLRGCLKNVFKIITNSAIRCNENGSISDGLLFWRDISKGGLFTESYVEDNYSRRDFPGYNRYHAYDHKRADFTEHTVRRNITAHRRRRSSGDGKSSG